MTMTFKQELQSFSQSGYIELFDLDTTNIGGGSTYHFTPHTYGNGYGSGKVNVLFQSNTFNDSTYWLTSNSSVTPNTQLGPDGLTYGSTLTTTAATNMYLAQILKMTDGTTTMSGYNQPFTFSIWLMGGTKTQAGFGLWGFNTTGGSGDLSLNTASIISGPGTLTNFGSNMIIINGLSTSVWTQVTVTGTSPWNISQLGCFFKANPTAFTAGDTIKMWGAQVELGSSTSAYQNTVGGPTIKWQGTIYTPFPIETTGFINNGTTAAPAKPTLSVSNANQFLLASVLSLGDLVGAKLTRWRTFSRFLDGQSDADPNAHFIPDVFLIDQKTSHTKNAIQWSLVSPMDRQGMLLPKRQILKDQTTSSDVYFPGVARTFR